MAVPGSPDASAGGAPPRPSDDPFNQSTPLQGYNLFDADQVLSEGIRREGGTAFVEEVREVGRRAGSSECIAWGFQANASPPVLHTHDRFGYRFDEVEFHPAWHQLLEFAVTHGMHGSPWVKQERGAHVGRAASFFLWSQVESGVGCPVSMTYAAVPTLRMQPDLAAVWEPLLVSNRYEPGLRPVAEKSGALVGMAMTERQGGSDVRANTTVAEPAGAGGPGAEHLLTGHKWFCSAPMCDAFLVLAQARAGLSCFLLPRVLPDGTRNAFHIQRLKDKLGNRSNASSEVQFDGAVAFMVGEEGRGIPTIVEMVNSTRLDCIIGSAALMRQAVAQATHHAAHRSAFGRRLADQPLMRNVLADLAVESEAATTLMLRLARATDGTADDDAQEALFKRIGTAVGKYWICKRGPGLVTEALECLGGNGYVEESIMPRLLREAPLNSIWEGSGNVNALDVLRAIGKDPLVLDAFFAEVELAAGADRRLDEHVAALRKDLSAPDELEHRARRLVESMALALQGALLVRHAPPAVADAFCSSRLAGDAGLAFGTLRPGIDTASVIERHLPLS
ncbi:MAG: isovaleryl-CoA dehydrogenase [Acidimicrobiales bacterium]